MNWKARCIWTTGRTASSARWTFPYQDLGCKSVISAATVERALALINSQVFDAALLDVNLNGNDSHPVAEALSARGVPFVYSTGNTGHSLREGYSDRPVLKKPFKYEELAAILAHLKLAPIER